MLVQTSPRVVQKFLQCGMDCQFDECNSVISTSASEEKSYFLSRRFLASQDFSFHSK